MALTLLKISLHNQSFLRREVPQPATNIHEDILDIFLPIAPASIEPDCIRAPPSC